VLATRGEGGTKLFAVTPALVFSSNGHDHPRARSTSDVSEYFPIFSKSNKNDFSKNKKILRE
jgi:hypothetical protein